MSEVNVRFVSEGKPAGGDEGGSAGSPAGSPTNRQTLSIHVGALRLEGGPSSGSEVTGGDDEISGISGISGDATTISRDPTEQEEDLIKKTSRSPKISWDLLLLILFSGSGWGLLAVLVALAFLFGVPLAMIIIGSIYLGVESCFDERIAILLIIGGVLSIFSVLTRATVTDDGVKGKKHHHHHHNHHHRHRHMWDETVEAPPPQKRTISWVQFFHGMITLVDCVWMVATSFFTYRIWTVVDLGDEDSEMYCDRTLYLFTFIYLTVVWIIFGISLIFLIIKLLVKSCVCVCGSPSPSA